MAYLPPSLRNKSNVNIFNVISNDIDTNTDPIKESIKPIKNKLKKAEKIKLQNEIKNSIYKSSSITVISIDDNSLTPILKTSKLTSKLTKTDFHFPNLDVLNILPRPVEKNTINYKNIIDKFNDPNVIQHTNEGLVIQDDNYINIPFQKIYDIIQESTIYRVQLNLNYVTQLMYIMNHIDVDTETVEMKELYSKTLNEKKLSTNIINAYFLLQDLKELTQMLLSGKFNESNKSNENCIVIFDNIWNNSMILEQFFNNEIVTFLTQIFNIMNNEHINLDKNIVTKFEEQLNSIIDDKIKLSNYCINVQIGKHEISFIGLENNFEFVSEIILENLDISKLCYFEKNLDSIESYEDLNNLIENINLPMNFDSGMLKMSVNSKKYLFRFILNDEMLDSLKHKISVNIIDKPDNCKIISSPINIVNNLDIVNENSIENELSYKLSQIHLEHQINVWLRKNQSFVDYMFELLYETSNLITIDDKNLFIKYCYENSI
jgi:hypothetical protein